MTDEFDIQPEGQYDTGDAEYWTHRWVYRLDETDGIDIEDFAKACLKQVLADYNGFQWSRGPGQSFSHEAYIDVKAETNWEFVVIIAQSGGLDV